MPVDVSMPKSLRERRTRARYCAVCAVGLLGEPGVFRLATAENVEGHLALIQPGNWRKVVFDRLYWTAGSAVARTIVTRCENFLTRKGDGMGHHWYRAPLDVLDDLVRAEAVSLNATVWSHEQLIGTLRTHANLEADRFAHGFY